LRGATIARATVTRGTVARGTVARGMLRRGTVAGTVARGLDHWVSDVPGANTPGACPKPSRPLIPEAGPKQIRVFVKIFLESVVFL